MVERWKGRKQTTNVILREAEDLLVRPRDHRADPVGLLRSLLRMTTVVLFPPFHPSRFPPHIDRLLFRTSVTSIQPGACVIANGIRAVAITDCGVTPQAQKTDSSFRPTTTGSP